MTVFIQYLVNGLSMGSVYAIIALGYTMVYGIAKMLNFAHGDVIMVGAYVSFCATSYLGLPCALQVRLRSLSRLSAFRISCKTPPSCCGVPRPRTSPLWSGSRFRHFWRSSTFLPCRSSPSSPVS